MTATCHRCGREFKNFRSLGQHSRALRSAAAKGGANRICPRQAHGRRGARHGIANHPTEGAAWTWSFRPAPQAQRMASDEPRRIQGQTERTASDG
jgi:hypothetical protein